MILEGLVTTLSGNGVLNVAPMGPQFNDGEARFELRPFDTSTTYRNLVETGCGVLHMTDNALLIAQCAIHQTPESLETVDAKAIAGKILNDCCRWFEFKANEIINDTQRKTFHCKIISRGKRRDFFGFNRAKHAVIEATILATRVEFIPIEEILDQFSRLETIVQKTGGNKELQAFSMLDDYVRQIGQSTNPRPVNDLAS